jgi:Gpi16 subunit, GPI transamidase component
MLKLFYLFSCVLSYKETLTYIPIDSSTLSIFNFTDSWSGELSVFSDLGEFPMPIIEILEETSSFSASLTWGTGEGIKQRLIEYTQKTGRALGISQPGMSVISETENWEIFAEKLSGLLCTFVSTSPDPIFIEKKRFWHVNDFLCKENLSKIENLLPCKNKGLVELFGQFYTSKYLSIELKGFKKDNQYAYSVYIASLKKEKYSNTQNKCNTSIEIFEKDLEEYSSDLKLSGIVLRPIKSDYYPKFVSRRYLIDEEHSFNAYFFHSLINNSSSPMFVSIYEYFPEPTIPLISSFSHNFSSIEKLDKGWLLKFDISLVGEETVYIKLNKKLMGFEDYPSDPQRGWDIPPMPMIYQNEIELSNGLLIMIPEPDFSMPFNVICITGTVLAFFFTSIQSLQTWKDSVHWSSETYEKNILKAKKIMDVLKNTILVISLIILYILDSKGIIKMFG